MSEPLILLLTITGATLLILFLLYRRMKRRWTHLHTLHQTLFDNIDRLIVALPSDTRLLSEEEQIERFAEYAGQLRQLADALADDNYTIHPDSFATNDRKQEHNLLASLRNLQAHLSQKAENERIRAIEEQQRNWVNQGLARFVDLLKAHNTDLDTLTYEMIKNLTEYLGASIGGVFIARQEYNEEEYLHMIASVAYDRKKILQKRIEPGEGLVGECYLEKITLYITEIPRGYIEITSGFGKGIPKSILIVPLKLEDKAYGVLEIASIEYIEPYQIQFVERVAESIASAIASLKNNEQTRRLLDASQSQAEEMASQEEEMRQNLEELQATQDLMRHQQDELEQANILMQKNQNDLRNALELSETREKEIQLKNRELKQREEELSEKLKELEETRHSLEQRQKEMEKTNIRMQQNEMILRKAVEKAKTKEKELLEKQAVAKDLEEKYKTAQAELQKAVESLTTYRRWLEAANQKIKTLEGR